MKIILHPTYFPSIAQFVAIVNATEIQWEMHDTFLKQTYRNRCYIMAANGKFALTIPIVHSQKDRKTYTQVEIFNLTNWQQQHWKSLVSAYSASPFFEFYDTDLMPLFETPAVNLFEFNINCFKVLCNCLKIKIKTTTTTTYAHHIKLPYVDFRHLATAKKETQYQFDGYTQVFSNKFPFASNLSILDLLFNEGPNSLNYLTAQKLI